MKYARGGIVRAFSAIAVVSGLAFLVACGGSGPSGVPITISLSATLTSLTPGQASTITAVVSNDSSNKGVTWSSAPSGFGTLSNQSATTVTYTAPTSVATATAVTITATSVASSTVTASTQISVQPSSISISLSPVAPQTINQGQQVSINATLTNDTGNKGVTWALSPQVGALTNQTATSATYVAPGTVSGNTAVTVTATSVASSSATSTLEITVFPSGAGPNVAALNVTTGPVPATSPQVDLAYISLTICVPGASTCQTVDNIQVDTGSNGLRILQSAIPGLSLPAVTDSNNGDAVNNCVQFLDTSYLWGPVQLADIKIGGEAALSTPVQIVSSSNTGIPTACTNGGTVNENTPDLLGANGIIGVGLEPTDCILAGVDYCDGSATSSPPAVYFECPSSGCQSTDAPIFVPANFQVTNPVVLFAADNNGDILQLPAVQSAAPTASGALIFGIETASNNTVGSTATLFDLDQNDNFVTGYNGQILTASFIDSGSNGLFFPSSIAVCQDNSSFYCPGSLTPQTATNTGTNNAPSIVNFDVDNADNLFNDNPNDAALSTLAGPNGTANTCSSGNGSCTFDWGLPFFFGRSVFTAIDGQNVANIGTGPFYAY
jgi:Protein of unknown function (DUF3443)